jgi:hypothetical protein
VGHNWYERHVLPWLVDIACSVRPVWRQRRKIVPLAPARVLEIGIGAGLNLEHYDKARIEKSLASIPASKCIPRPAGAAGARG